MEIDQEIESKTVQTGIRRFCVVNDLNSPCTLGISLCDSALRFLTYSHLVILNVLAYQIR